MGLFSTSARTEFTAEDRADQTALGLCAPDLTEELRVVGRFLVLGFFCLFFGLFACFF